MSDTIIRQMRVEDIDQVMQVEAVSFGTPWTRDIFLNELNENPYAIYFVMEKAGVVIGYCGLWVIIDEAQITNIAILPEYRGRKFGKALFHFVMNQAIALGAGQLSLEVRVSNIPAQNMYKKFGLVPGGIRKNYYTDNYEDALVMWVKL
ncbi:ribosomal protein S18-alanine N-acetyltransferase [Sediminibacillus albus]|uniref:[Ribosomal protein bS18]-alanine N-acetyltransferase n=1 Tax=Sediminibacillus albus TaxID=407036 RepID=A0A1G9BFT2_9BACI|nr:ribosomal protein S18-alanine N-acetyltransferase [Sediminibacillus albus]SDK38396.1 ribosomal-protein-alanine N-acetyltransferase [Sediminibacillus albus]